MNWLKSIGEAFYNAWVPEKRYLAYLSGLRMTLLISLFAVILGILIGILIAVTRVSSRHTKSPVVKFLNKLAVLYVTVIRGTPMRRGRMLRDQLGGLCRGDHPGRH